MQHAQEQDARLPRLQGLGNPCRYKFIPFFEEKIACPFLPCFDRHRIFDIPGFENLFDQMIFFDQQFRGFCAHDSRPFFDQAGQDLVVRAPLFCQFHNNIQLFFTYRQTILVNAGPGIRKGKFIEICFHIRPETFDKIDFLPPNPLAELLKGYLSDGLAQGAHIRLAMNNGEVQEGSRGHGFSNEVREYGIVSMEIFPYLYGIRSSMSSGS